MKSRQSVFDELRAPAPDAARARARFPVVILGGGVNGIGLFRELSLQGVRCLLVDRADFAAGASSKSSRMIHGGLRYLENREFALVRESLFERNRLLDNAAHYVSPLRTLIPLYSRFGGLVRSALIFCGFSVRPAVRGSIITRIGLMFYDLVTRHDRRTPTHVMAGRSESLRQVKGLNPAIVATATYWDAWITQAERLCIEMIGDAESAQPQSSAVNYVEPVGAEGGRLQLRDVLSGETFEIEADVVVNATGAWVDFTNAILGQPTEFMGGTKGSHLVVDCPELYQALGDQMVYYQHPDGRVCIAFRFIDRVIIGSTDIPVADPSSARCTDEEVDYMLGTLRGVFPNIELSRRHIVYQFCGVRPLPASNRANVTANISRGHTIYTLEPGGPRTFPIFSLIGGKWTTFRALAEQTADRILPRLGVQRRCSTRNQPIGGGRDFPKDPQRRTEWIERIARSSGLAPQRISDLAARYGSRAEALADELKRSGDVPLCTLPAYSRQEIEHIVAHERVVHLADLVYRRSIIGLVGHATPEVLAELADVLAPLFNWSAAQRQDELRAAQWK